MAEDFSAKALEVAVNIASIQSKTSEEKNTEAQEIKRIFNILTETE